MKSIRRLYFYLVAFISIEVVLWGLVGLLRSIAEDRISGGADALAQALALILVGVPIFLFHWLWVQRAAGREEEEKTATLRAVFFYAVAVYVGQQVGILAVEGFVAVFAILSVWIVLKMRGNFRDTENFMPQKIESTL